MKPQRHSTRRATQQQGTDQQPQQSSYILPPPYYSGTTTPEKSTAPPHPHATSPNQNQSATTRPTPDQQQQQQQQQQQPRHPRQQNTATAAVTAPAASTATATTSSNACTNNNGAVTSAANAAAANQNQNQNQNQAQPQHQHHNVRFDVVGSAGGGEKVVVGACRFALGSRIGNGSFGEIFQGKLLVSEGRQATDLQTGTQVAVKLERARMRQSQLISEYNLYKKLSPAEGIPSVFWCGTEGEYQIMAMELLGPSLDDLHQYCNNIFSLKTVLMIGLQMIDRLSYVHSKGWVHRDLKPQNFLMGCGQTANIVHIIDLGLAKQYRDPITQQHIPRNKGLSMTGTARYASINTHLGFEQSRRDDLEALGYMLVYFLKGRLPWMGMQANTRHSKESLILDHKLTTPPDILCSGLPGEFATYLKYCGGLQFSQDPDYAYLKKLLQDLFVKCNYTSDNMYDWTLKKVKQHEEWLADIGAVFCAHID